MAHPPVPGLKDPDMWKMVCSMRDNLGAASRLMGRHEKDDKGKEVVWVSCSKKLVDQCIFKIDHYDQNAKEK